MTSYIKGSAENNFFSKCLFYGKYFLTFLISESVDNVFNATLTKCPADDSQGGGRDIKSMNNFVD